ncbi:lipase [Planctomycetia bacterium]|nr:lipase [Planctomycetia bacterium]
MKYWLKKAAVWLGLPLLALLLAAAAVYWYWAMVPYRLTADIRYGTRDKEPLLLDVFTPPKQNGAAVLMMVSGSWKSGAGSVRPLLFAPFLRRGYTVFAVRHISQPECTISEIVEDVSRAVRFVRSKAADYGVDPLRFGVIGGSSGGHLSLMLGTTGGPGDAAAEDTVDRESSAVQCIACFYPPTDLLNLGTSTENPGDGGPPKSFRKGFGPRAETMEQWKVLGRELSPIYHVTTQMPPTLIVHGDSDTLVPLDQSQRFVEEARKQGATVQLQVRPGKGHGWPTMVLDILEFARWFDQHLHSQPAAGAQSDGP